jgi:hypothetical protein
MSVELLATKSAQKILSQPGAMPDHVKQSLVTKLSEPEKYMEPKGRGFYGIDLVDGYRTFLTMNDDKQPVLAFVGDHDDYFKLSNQVKADPDAVREKMNLDSAQPVTLSHKKVDGHVSMEQFAQKYENAVAGVGRVAGVAMDNASANSATQSQDMKEAEPFLKSAHDKFVAHNHETDARHIYDPESEVLVSIDKSGKWQVDYGADETFSAIDAKYGAEVMDAAGARNYAHYGTGLHGSKFLQNADDIKGIGKNSGLVGGIIFGIGAGAATLAAGGSTAQAAEAVYETAVPYGETQIDLARGDIKAAARSATVETASNAGGVAGAAAGAFAGAAAGSVIPGLGTAAGAITGGIAGGLGGGMGAAAATEYTLDNAPGAWDKLVSISDSALDSASRFLGITAPATPDTPQTTNIAPKPRTPGIKL